MTTYKRNPQFMPLLMERLQTATTNAAGIAADKSRERIREPGGGEHHEGLSARSSAPGEPPASQSGELFDSMYHEERDGERDVMRARYGNTALHARFQELGTRSIRPRPFIRPPIVEDKEAIMEAFRDIMR